MRFKVWVLGGDGREVLTYSSSIITNWLPPPLLLPLLLLYLLWAELSSPIPSLYVEALIPGPHSRTVFGDSL